MIQWYPGHMAKALREVSEKIKLVDVVVIVLDARVPMSSLNPEIVKLVNNKRVLIVLNKKDKADPNQSAFWKKHYEDKNYQAIIINSKDNKDIKSICLERECLYGNCFWIFIIDLFLHVSGKVDSEKM